MCKCASRELFSADARELGHEVNQTAQTSNKHRNFTYMIAASHKNTEGNREKSPMKFYEMALKQKKNRLEMRTFCASASMDRLHNGQNFEKIRTKHLKLSKIAKFGCEML